MNKHISIILIVSAMTSLAQQNLLLNGGFEGTLDGWIPRATKASVAQVADAPQGGFVLRVEGGGFVHSQPILMAPRKTYTVAGWARAMTPEGAGKTLHMTIHPTPRQAGNLPFAIGRGGNPKKTWQDPVLATKWERFTFQLTLPDYAVEGHDLPSPWWWDSKSWWLFFEARDGATYELDGLSVTEGTTAAQGFVGETPVSVGVEIIDLPPYNPTVRLLERGATVTARAGLNNTTAKPLDARVIWELADYAGKKIFARAEERVTLKAGETRVLTRRQKLSANGTLLVRCSVLATDGATLGQSHAPATVLPFPKAATRIDAAERFGGTYVAGNPPADHFMTPVAQKIGLRWTRWYPMMNWVAVQPDGPEQWRIPAVVLDAQQKRGIGCNVVLYSLPKWVRGNHHNLPRDMQDWTADDPRWDDLTIETHWDKFVKGMLQRCPGPGFAWEIANEPEFDRWDHNLYFQFVKRTSRVIKSIDPKAKVMIDSVNGFDNISKGFAARGGAEFIDVLTFHNYTSGGFASAESIATMRRTFTRKDGSAPEIWFNEGWTWTPTSHNAPGRGMLSTRTPEEAAHIFVRAHAETFAAGMDKMIYFNMTYPTHGRSWWDWAGDGTEMWDDHDEPTVAVPALNVMVDQLGLSDSLGSIRSADAWMHVFHDRRNNRGVAVMWAAAGDAHVELPVAGLRAMDLMANPEPVENLPVSTRIALTGAPVYVFKNGASGAQLFAALKTLERPVMEGLDRGVYTPPKNWMKRGANGNPYLFNGRPLWSFARVMPADFSNPAHYIRFDQWDNGQAKWRHSTQMQGGQPDAGMNQEGELQFGVRSPWGGPEHDKPAALVFHAPEDGTYQLDAVIHLWRWEGGQTGALLVNLLNSEQNGVQQLTRVETPHLQNTPVTFEAIELRQGQRLALVFRFEGMHTAGTFTIKSLAITKK